MEKKKKSTRYWFFEGKKKYKSSLAIIIPLALTSPSRKVKEQILEGGENH